MSDPWGNAGSKVEPARVQISGTHVELMNLGDHGERVRRPIAVDPDETVEQLIRRVFTDIDAPYRTHDTADVIELQVLVLPEASS